jgi:hypothetical protein
MPLLPDNGWSMDMNLGSAAYSDEAFVAEIESCTYPAAMFRHQDHLRLAFLYSKRFEYAAAEERMAKSIQRFAISAGATKKYHHTVTLAWMRLVAGAIELAPNENTFDDFLGTHSWLADKDLIATYYSNEVLASDRARAEWVEPDLRPLPPIRAIAKGRG